MRILHEYSRKWMLLARAVGVEHVEITALVTLQNGQNCGGAVQNPYIISDSLTNLAKFQKHIVNFFLKIKSQAATLGMGDFSMIGFWLCIFRVLFFFENNY